MEENSSSSTSLAGRCYAFILAGGSGTRLWPLSRMFSPKQLLALQGERSLLQETAGRILEVLPPERIQTVTNEEHVFEVRKQLAVVDPLLADQVLAEPLGRNTLPAILLGLDIVIRQDPDALVAVFPSDHVIQQPTAFATAIGRAIELAAIGWFVTVGIVPSQPETGYGYIHRGADLGNLAFEVVNFVEKPDQTRAEFFLASGEYYWNSGIFVFPMTHFLKEVERLQPDIFAWWCGRINSQLIAGYSDLPEVSIDYGIIEHMEHIAVVTADLGWDDLGSWKSVYRLGAHDGHDCVIQGDVLALNCSDSLLLSHGGKLAAVGLTGIIAVQTRDAILVCSMDHVQQVKDVVEQLKREGSSLIATHVTVHRPWGNYTVLEKRPYCKIKHIVVLPGAKLSLQMHYHRSEHWVIITGTALVKVNKEEKLLSENQSVYIPKAIVHRISNLGKVPLEIIEIQNGPYLEEDDIVRFDDMYGRCND
ncbi:mannose-1-phosphate guanylyltransferase [Desulfovibrionales bacterium]